jgi:poly-gamma-glutamate synthesis protein (capsule biosynthesis protein)
MNVFWTLLGVYFALVALFLLCPLPYPLPTESDYAHASFPSWHIYYFHKYLHPITRAARGSGLEEYFQNLPALPESSQLTDVRKISITAMGDLWSQNDVTEEQSKFLWDEVGHQVFGGDISMANLEFVIQTSDEPKSKMVHCVSEKGGRPMTGDDRFGRFSFMSLGNNHINDASLQGMNDTRRFMDRMGIAHAGASHADPEEARFPILDRNGIKVALLSYSYTVNGLSMEEGLKRGISLVRFNALKDEEYDPSLIHRDIALARERGVDLIVCSNHWGLDFECFPPPRIVNRARDLIDAGVDIIVGHHPHVINPVEIYEAKDGRKGLILYSLGNVSFFSFPRAIAKMGMIADITVEAGIDDTGARKVLVTGCTLMPTYLSMKTGPDENEYRILHLFKQAEAIRKGNPSPYLSKKDARKILYLDKLFRKRFVQKNLSYM